MHLPETPATADTRRVSAPLRRIAAGHRLFVRDRGMGAPFVPQAAARTIGWLGATAVDTSRRIMIDFQQMIAETDPTDDAAAPTVPVTTIHGELDLSAPVDLTARRYAMIIPDVDMIVCEGVAHGPRVTHPVRLVAGIAARAGMGWTCRRVAA